MKTENIHHHVPDKFNFRPRFLKFNRKRRKRDRHFQDILDSYLIEAAEELEDYPLHLSRGSFEVDSDIEEVS
jgi:hypothetical protein